jgi:hypothetical protein
MSEWAGQRGAAGLETAACLETPRTRIAAGNSWEFEKNLSDPSFFSSSLFFFSLSSLSFKKKKNSRQGSNPLKMGIPKRVPSLNSQVEARCREMGGDRAIHSVLVANNGLAAVKFIRSVRSWAYKTFGNERAVAIVAMATPEDMRIDAEHIRMADQFVEVS